MKYNYDEYEYDESVLRSSFKKKDTYTSIIRTNTIKRVWYGNANVLVYAYVRKPGGNASQRNVGTNRATVRLPRGCRATIVI